MPSLQTTPSKRLMCTLRSLRPPHPLRLRAAHNTNHLLGNRQIRINCRRERMNQFGIVMIPQPQHGTAVRAEVALRWAALFVRCAACFDCWVFSTPSARPLSGNIVRFEAYLMNSSPLETFRLFAIPPKFTLPPYPPTFRQILQAQSWYGTGVLESTANCTPPHWQLPSRRLVDVVG